MTLRWWCTVGLVSVAAVNGGCQKSEIETRSEELVAPIREGIDNPSGIVDAESASKLLTRLYGEETSGLDQMLVTTTTHDPACSQGEGTVDDPFITDMACLSDGVTGRATVTIDADDDRVLSLIVYEDVCLTDIDFCIDGDGAFADYFDDDGTTNLLGSDVVVRRDGISEAEVFGVAITPTRAGAVFFIDGASFIVGLLPSLDFDGESFVTLAGANGEFECAFTDGGRSGSCTGPTSFEWLDPAG